MASETDSRPKDFDSFMKEVMTRAMRDVLGQSAAQAIMYHVRLDRFDDPRLIHSALTQLLDHGAESLEHVIAARLLKETGVSPSNDRDDFVSDVDLVKKSFAKRRIGRQI